MISCSRLGVAITFIFLFQLDKTKIFFHVWKITWWKIWTYIENGIKRTCFCILGILTWLCVSIYRDDDYEKLRIRWSSYNDKTLYRWIRWSYPCCWHSVALRRIFSGFRGKLDGKKSISSRIIGMGRTACGREIAPSSDLYLSLTS